MTNTQQFFSQVLDAVQHRQWMLVVALGVVGFVAAARFVVPKMHNAFGAWLNTQRGGAFLALLSGVGGSMVTALIAGAKPSINVVITGFGVGFAAIGGWNAFFDLFLPKDSKAALARANRHVVNPSNDDTPSVPPPSMPSAAALLPFLAIPLLFSLSGCYCWETAHEQEPKCVIAHDVVECAEGDAALAVSIAASLITSIETQMPVDLATIEAIAEQMGFKLGGCFWAKLEDYLNLPSATPARVATVAKVHGSLVTFKQKFNSPLTKFCFTSPRTAQRVCR